MAIKLAVRRNPHFRFDYFLRSLPVDLLGRRCEQLMKAAEKEVEQLEKKARELAGLPTEPEKEGEVLPPIKLPMFRVLQKQRRIDSKTQAEKEKKELEQNVIEIESQIQELQDKLRALNEGAYSGATDEQDGNNKSVFTSHEQTVADHVDSVPIEHNSDEGAIGPNGKFVEFPQYDGIEHPSEWKKPFTHFCYHTRREIKSSMDPTEKKDKVSTIEPYLVSPLKLI